MSNNKREHIHETTYQPYQHITEHVTECDHEKSHESFVAGYTKATDDAIATLCGLCDFSTNGKKPFECETYPCNRFRLFRKALENNLYVIEQ